MRTASRLSRGGLKDASGTAAKDTISIGSGDREAERTAWGWRFILWKIRIPRALCAFLVGGALAASGAVIQSILQNPLASSYTLGVSSGACLGTALVIISGAGGAAIGYVLLPAAGFGCGLLTVLLVILIASRLDAGFQNHTIILFGKNSTTQNPCVLC